MSPEHVQMTGDLVVSEKIEGVNSRLVFTPDMSYVIGSREELLYAKGDLIGNPAMGIVDALTPIAAKCNWRSSEIYTLYFETFGGKTTASSKQYTSERKVGVCLFDVAKFIQGEEQLAAWDISKFSTWRESGKIPFLSEGVLREFAHSHNLFLAPRKIESAIPSSIEDTYEWLKLVMPTTRVALDDGAGMRPEGVVVRTMNRDKIVKIRFEDYEHTLGIRRAKK